MALDLVEGHVPLLPLDSSLSLGEIANVGKF